LKYVGRRVQITCWTLNLTEGRGHLGVNCVLPGMKYTGLFHLHRLAGL
jgi:hypothetical protein